jgi:hypothetical protein
MLSLAAVLAAAAAVVPALGAVDAHSVSIAETPFGTQPPAAVVRAADASLGRDWSSVPR